MDKVLHHLHKRKRIYQRHEQYPHPDALKRFVDRVVYAVGILGPLTGLAQVTKIWIHKDASGVSMILFGSSALFSIVWIVYGILHKELPITMMYILWFIVNSLVVVGTLLYS